MDGKFVIGYSGNMGRAHDFETLLSAMEALNTTFSNATVVFLFIGGGHQRDYLALQAQQRAIKNIQFRPYQPRERLQESLGVADVHLISLLPALEGLIMPSKFYGIAASGRPALFIGAENGEIAQLLHQGHCGYGVSVGAVEKLKAHILKLQNNPKHCQQLGYNARALFEQRFDRRIACSHWAALLDDLSN